VRRVLTLAALIALSACGREAAHPLFDSRTPPALSPRFFPPEGWAWGQIAQPGAPLIRYGTVSPAAQPRAHVVILPAYGESAEVYYETARDLTAHGYAVWVLDAAGQGGSQRFAGPVDLGRSNGFGLDAAALEGLVTGVIRPDGHRPVVIAASGDAALTALLAAEAGKAPLDGLVLWDPPAGAPVEADHAREMTDRKLGALRAGGGQPWSRPNIDLSGRATLPAAWQLANPDLRMGGPAWEWIAAEDRARRDALDKAKARDLRSALLILEAAPDAGTTTLCAAAPHCRLQPAPPSGALPRHLAPDPVRAPWLDALTAFIEARIAERPQTN
jgi:lysophospholipase